MVRTVAAGENLHSSILQNACEDKEKRERGLCFSFC